MSERIRVLSIDDHRLAREGIAAVVNSQPNMQIVAQASSGREALVSYREHRPDVTLMDLRLPDMSGIDATAAIRREFPDARIIILTTFDSENERHEALAAGASAFVLKSATPKKIVEAIHQVHGQAG